MIFSEVLDSQSRRTCGLDQAGSVGIKASGLEPVSIHWTNSKLKQAKEQVKSSNFHPSTDSLIIIMKVYMSVLLLLGIVFAIAVAGPVSEETLKGIISKALSQEVHAINGSLRTSSSSLCKVS